MLCGLGLDKIRVILEDENMAEEDDLEREERRKRAALSRKFAHDAMIERQKFLEAEKRREEEESL